MDFYTPNPTFSITSFSSWSRFFSVFFETLITLLEQPSSFITSYKWISTLPIRPFLLLLFPVGQGFFLFSFHHHFRIIDFLNSIKLSNFWILENFKLCCCYNFFLHSSQSLKMLDGVCIVCAALRNCILSLFFYP